MSDASNHEQKAEEKLWWEKYMEDEKIREFMNLYWNKRKESMPKALEALDSGIMRFSEELNRCDLTTAATLAPILRDLAETRVALSSNGARNP